MLLGLPACSSSERVEPRRTRFGRLVEEKGYGELITAAIDLRARCPQIRIVVAGPSDPAKADALSEEAGGAWHG